MEPNPSVKKPATNVMIAAHSSAGQNSNLPASAACWMTGITPWVSSDIKNAIHNKPITITVICTTVVSATDHIPPNRVYKSTTLAPITMPIAILISPPVNTLKVKPKAEICADTQPRYERAIAIDTAISTGLLNLSR